MDLQLLVSTMNQHDHKLLEKMNINSDAIIVNQCDRNKFEEFEYKGNKIKLLSFPERGVGLSRNNALMRATADVCLFADDDVKYVDNYKEMVCKAFKEITDADIIVFNVPSTNPDRPSPQINKRSRVRWYNCLRYGTFTIAIRNESIKIKNISFHLLFGGGARYGSGEDAIFIFECVKKGLKIYADPTIIGYVSHEDSSWFDGYKDKYFFDKGVLYAYLSNRWAKLLCLQFVLRHRRMFSNDKSWIEAFQLMSKGIKEIKGKR